MPTTNPPSAYCTNCQKYSGAPRRINLRCGIMINNKRCDCVNSSALNSDDWASCNLCSGKGCKSCQYFGVKLNRTPYVI